MSAKCEASRTLRSENEGKMNSERHGGGELARRFRHIVSGCRFVCLNNIVNTFVKRRTATAAVAASASASHLPKRPPAELFVKIKPPCPPDLVRLRELKELSNYKCLDGRLTKSVFSPLLFSFSFFLVSSCHFVMALLINDANRVIIRE